MTRLLVAVIYLVSLVTTSAAQVVGAAPRSNRKSVIPMGQKYAQQKQAGITVLADTPQGVAKPNWDGEYTSSKNNEEELSKSLEKALSTQLILADSCQVEAALGLDSTLCKAEKTGKVAQAQPQTDSLSGKEAKAILRDLSTRLYKAAKSEKDPNMLRSINQHMLTLFPIFESLGALDPEAKKWETHNLRSFIRQHNNACVSKEAYRDCPAAITAISVLAVLSDGGMTDANLIYDFLKANYQSRFASSLVQTSAIALLALGRSNQLVAFLEEVDKNSLGYLSRLGNIVSPQYWAEKTIETMKGGERLVSRANEASYYATKIGNETRRADEGGYFIRKTENGRILYGNIYYDLGYFLATDENYKGQLKQYFHEFIHANPNGTIQVASPMFVLGALLGGMSVPSTKEMATVGESWNGEGKGSHVDTRANWNAVQKKLDQLHINTTSLVLVELYHHPKAEMTNAQRIALNNMIVDRYLKVTPNFNGKIYQPQWMNKRKITGTTAFKDQLNEEVTQLATAADYVIVVVSIPAAGVGLAKLGVLALRNARVVMAAARAQKGVLTVSQLRTLASWRNSLKASKAAGAFAGRTIAQNYGVEAAKVVTESANNLQKTFKAAAAVTKGAATAGKEVPELASKAGKRPVWQPNTQPVGAQAAVENAGATSRAPVKPVELGPAKPDGVPAETPTTEAVSPAKLQQQVTGPLAQRVQEGKSAAQSGKPGFFKRIFGKKEPETMIVNNGKSTEILRADKHGRFLDSNGNLRYVTENGQVRAPTVTEKADVLLEKSAAQSGKPGFFKRMFGKKEPEPLVINHGAEGGVEFIYPDAAGRYIDRNGTFIKSIRNGKEYFPTSTERQAVAAERDVSVSKTTGATDPGPLAQKVEKAKKAYVSSETSQMGVSLQSDLMASSGAGKVEYLGATPKGNGIEIIVETPQGQTLATLSNEDLMILSRGDTIDFGSFTLDKNTISFLQDVGKVDTAIKANLQAAKKAIQKPGFFKRMFGKNAEKTNVANKIDDPAKAYQNAHKGGTVELNENELVRFNGNGGRTVNQDYVQASKEARKYMIDSVESGEYTASTDSYMETMNTMHKVSAEGKNGNLNWYGTVGQGDLSVNSGKIRVGGRAKSSRPEQAKKVEEIAKQYGDPFRMTRNSKVELANIPPDNLPRNIDIEGTFFHFYPKGGNNLRPYYAQMHRTAKEAVDLINQHASEREILGKLAEHYQYAANARPYYQINNSLFMNETNTLLQKAGLKPMPHGELDFAAIHLQPATFKKYFIDTYYKTRL